MTVQNDGQFQMNVSALKAARGIATKPVGNITPNPPTVRGFKNANQSIRNGAGQTDFAEIFDQAAQRNKASGLKISKHAESRLNERNIQLSDMQREKIADALVKADRKGVKDALVMIDGLAIVANTRSMTVITAAGENDLRQNIFTNIDGAVFA